MLAAQADAATQRRRVAETEEVLRESKVGVGVGVGVGAGVRGGLTSYTLSLYLPYISPISPYISYMPAAPRAGQSA